MSVIGMNSITVMKMHSVLTWMGVITVLATLGTVEMDTPVQVSSIHCSCSLLHKSACVM